MVALWYLLVLAPFIAIPILWWHYRRKQAARERMASERWQKIVSNSAGVEQAVAGTAAPIQASPSGQTLQAPYQRRDRLLDPAHTLMYYLLRTALAEHEVLTQVSLDRLLMVPAHTPGLEQERRMRGLAQHAVAFVVCDKTMQPLAAVDLLEAEAPAALTAAPDFRSQCFAHSGIRYVRIARTALPKRHEVRALVLGEAAAG